MKLLLTSNGLSNDSIAKAYAELVGKKPNDTKVAFIPTAANVERGDKSWLINDLYRIKQRGYFVDILEIASLKQEEIENVLNESDAIFVGGGNTYYLSYWMQQKGLFELLPGLLKTKVYAGISAGSIIASARMLTSQAIKNGYIDKTYSERSLREDGSDKTLKLATFSFMPHLNSQSFPMVNIDNMTKIAKEVGGPLYALDDNSALKVVDEKVEVVSEGQWKLFNQK